MDNNPYIPQSSAQPKPPTTWAPQSTLEHTFSASTRLPPPPVPNSTPTARPANVSSPHLTQTLTFSHHTVPPQIPGLPSPDPESAAPPKKKPAAAKEERQPGTSLLPLSRVQKIMKADKELGAAGKEAVFLIAVAAEEFIKRLVLAGHAQSRREGRMTVLHRDLALAVKRADELTFLEEIIPQMIPASVALAKREAKLKEKEQRERESGGGGNAGETVIGKAFANVKGKAPAVAGSSGADTPNPPAPAPRKSKSKASLAGPGPEPEEE